MGTSESSEKTLEGWRTIAEHLGKSVRSVQRWEVTLGLPVHRRVNEDGAVFARVDEIDAWRRSLDRELEDVPDTPARVPHPFVEWVLVRRKIGVLIALICGSLGLATGWHSSRATKAAAEFLLSEDVLEARDVSGRTVWRHRFGEPASLFTDTRRVTRVADLDGDGESEVFVPIRFAPNGGSASSTDAVYAFTRPGGDIKWVVRPDVTLDFQGEAVSGPWELIDVVISKLATPRRLWLVYGRADGAGAAVHLPTAPGFVIEVEADGKSRLRYVQAGRIASMVSWTTPAGDFLAVGGAVDGDGSASLVLMRDDDPPASFYGPGIKPACNSCPAGEVRRVVLFPSTEIGRLVTPAPSLSAANEYVPRLWLQYREGTSGGAIVVFNPDFSFDSFRFAASHWGNHRLHERSGKLTHAAAECPELRVPMTAREWTPSGGWREWTFVPD
jgi:hypothetical protein